MSKQLRAIKAELESLEREYQEARPAIEAEVRAAEANLSDALVRLQRAKEQHGSTVQGYNDRRSALDKQLRDMESGADKEQGFFFSNDRGSGFVMPAKQI